MSESLEDKIGSLDRLTIDRAQRPVDSRFGWVKLFVIIVVVVVLAAGAAWWYSSTTGVNIVESLSQRPVEVNLLVVHKAERGAKPIALVASGKIVSDRRVNVATKVSGQIIELAVEQGDIVEKDQVLARIEDTLYLAQRDEALAVLKRKEHAVAEARSESTRAAADVVRAEADRAFELRNFERLRGLEAQGRASEFEFLNAKNKYEAAEAAVEVAKAGAASAVISIDASVADLNAAEASLRQLQKRLDDCAIRAPIAGVVLERNAQVGDFLAAEGGRGANANAQLVSVADMTLLRVEIDISERDVHRLTPQQAARITPDADRDRSFPGEIMWIDPIGDYAKGTVQVKVRVLDPDPTLRIDGSAKVEFLRDVPDSTTTAEASKTFWLPKSAIKLTPGSDDAFVFTVREERTLATAVKIGARTDQSVEVVSGVYAGMQIVADNAADLSDDAPVVIIDTIDGDTG